MQRPALDPVVKSSFTLKDGTRTTRAGICPGQIEEGPVLTFRDDSWSDVDGLRSEMTIVSLPIDENDLVTDVIYARKLWIVRYIDVDE